MRTIKRIALVAAAFVPLVMLGAPANAAGGGAAAFVGDVSLATFPCAGCSASFDSSIAAGVGVGSGPDLAIVDHIHADVTYWERCFPTSPVNVGTADGTATLTGTNIVGSLLPTTASFGWVRVGLVAVISPVTVKLTTGAPIVPFPLPAIVGAAVFLPSGGLTNCTGGSVTATIIGAAALITL